MLGHGHLLLLPGLLPEDVPGLNAQASYCVSSACQFIVENSGHTMPGWHTGRDRIFRPGCDDPDHRCPINIPGCRCKPLGPGRAYETIWNWNMNTASDHQDRIPSATCGRSQGEGICTRQLLNIDAHLSSRPLPTSCLPRRWTGRPSVAKYRMYESDHLCIPVHRPSPWRDEGIEWDIGTGSA